MKPTQRYFLLLWNFIGSFTTQVVIVAQQTKAPIDIARTYYTVGRQHREFHLLTARVITRDGAYSL